jgi:hypothetical protein
MTPTSSAAAASPKQLEVAVQTVLSAAVADAHTALTTIDKMCDNVIQHPQEPKYRRVRVLKRTLLYRSCCHRFSANGLCFTQVKKSNAIVQRKVMSVPGALGAAAKPAPVSAALVRLVCAMGR